MIAVTTVAAVLAAVVLGATGARRRRGDGRRRVRWGVLVLTVAVAAALTPYVVADSGAAAGYLLGVPVLAAALPVLADLAGTGRMIADVGGAVVMTGWALLLGLGIGPAFLPGAFLLVLVALLDLGPVPPRDPADQSQHAG